MGTFQLTLIPGLARGGTKRLQIEAVRLGPSTRGRGLGTAMFAWAPDYGRRHGATLAQLTTDKKRTDAHRFYDNLGYAPTHEGYNSRFNTLTCRDAVVLSHQGHTDAAMISKCERPSGIPSVTR